MIVDYHLPGIQGDELCRQIHMDLTTRSIPILMLTADETQATEPARSGIRCRRLRLQVRGRGHPAAPGT
ncbi:MAG: hypothetical protein NVV74_20815 [Magnetospirillum sp.]|nr:hypothetical protein [Magnetospirillum sp.]